MDFQSLMESAKKAHRAGRNEKAQALYARILAEDPNHVEALHFQGVLLHQTGNTQAGILLIEKAIRLEPDHCVFLNNLGILYSAVGQSEKAKTCYLKALACDPASVEAWYNLGNIHHCCGKLQDAEQCYRKALSFKIDYLDAWNNLAAVLLDQGNPDEAVKCCNRIVSHDDGYVPVYTNLGNALKRKGALHEALICFEKAIALNPNDAICRANIANALLETGRADLAIREFRKSIAIDPSHAEAFGGMGVALRMLGRLEEGIGYLKKAIDLMPGDPKSYQNLGNLYIECNEPEKALACYRQAIRLRPEDPSLHLNTGLAFFEMGRGDEALQAYEQAVRYDPEYEKAWVHLTHFFQETCDWRNLERVNAKVDSMTLNALRQQKRPEEMPFLNLARHADPALNYRVAEAWSAQIAKRIPRPFSHLPSSPATVQKRITIGYLSNNFKNHPTSHLIAGIFEHHDRDRFNIFCYSYGENDGSSYRRRIERSVDRFVDLSKTHHQRSVDSIQQDEVNILVDLVGYMRHSRIEIAACRPAPVQVRWLGMAGTTGADFFDYILTHSLVTPLEDAPYYSEKLVYLPDCYQVNDDRQKMAQVTITRDDEGLPEPAFVLCCFCTPYKIDRSVFECWVRILKKCPQCVLWLLGGGRRTCENLKNAAQEMGIDPSRLIFATKMPREWHLKRLGLADLGVDTWKVNGAATTSDALWAGIPVVTRLGRHFASRMSANILTAMGLSQLVEDDADAYERRIIHYCNHPNELHQLKEDLRNKKSTAPLFDTSRFVKHLEAAYTMIWDRYINGKAPRQFEILT